MWGILLPQLAISLIGEEMTYRTLIQGSAVSVIGTPAGIGAASLLFGLAHFAPGPGLVVLTDVGLIVFPPVLWHDVCPPQQPVGGLAGASVRRYFGVDHFGFGLIMSASPSSARVPRATSSLCIGWVKVCRSSLQVLLAAPQNFAGSIQAEGLPIYPLREGRSQIMASETGQ